MSSHPWTKEQAEAVAASDDILLTANAGTGKTTTVVGKILWALGLPVAPGPDGPLTPPAEVLDIGQVVAITFTEKAAHDLERKLRAALEATEEGSTLRWRLDEAYIGTIHGFCASLLREHALRLGIDPTFRVLDQRESRANQEDIVRGIVLGALQDEDRGAELLARRFKLYGFVFSDGIIDMVRSMMRDLRWHDEKYDRWTTDHHLDRDKLQEICEEWTDGSDDEALELTSGLYSLAQVALERWESFQLDENARDFDALILDTRDLLCGTAGLSALPEIRRRCRLLIIDELQDTDFAQRDLAFAIAGEEADDGPQLFFVGDPKQSIYRFRGADVSVWNAVEKALRGRGRELPLTVSFRSTPAVVDLVNDVCGRFMNTVASDLEAEAMPSAIPYSELQAARKDEGVGGSDYIHISSTNAAGKRPEEGHKVGAYIKQLIEDQAQVQDPDTGELRACRYADVALLYRASTDIQLVAQALREAGIPFRMSGTPHLERRLEVLDLVNLLRVLLDSGDDLSAFGFLRSPFVTLRDDVIASMRLFTSKRPLLRQAAKFVDEGDWPASDVAAVAELEREALTRALEALDEARALVGRRSLDEIVDVVIERTGYREHLVLSDGYEEALSNMQGFLRMLEGYKALDLGQFLDMWDRWAGEDSGIPQAAMHSPDDDVVTLSTVHSAKGLEWPVVALIKGDANPWRAPTNELRTDPTLGPIIVPRQADRGGRAARIVDREELEERAEAARLLYVALTRARDRVVVTGYEKFHAESSWGWVQPAVGAGIITPVQPPALVSEVPPLPSLAWLDRVVDGPAPAMVAPLPSPAGHWLTSATELMLRDKDPEAWERKYVHGALASWEFTPQLGKEPVPANVRGTVIHGVLERIAEEADLARLLDETIGSLDDPDVENVLGAGSSYREALEKEIAAFVGTPEWAEFTEGDHYRELSFIHLVGEREWRAGALDLYRPGEPTALVVDFKTHPVKTAAEAEVVRKGYGVQVAVYRAVGELVGSTEVRLEFTKLAGEG